MSELNRLFGYIKKETPVHRLSGASKAVFFLCSSVLAMLTFHTPLLAFTLVIIMALFCTARIQLRETSLFLGIALLFLLMNNVFVFLFAPEYGCEVYGTRHLLFTLWGGVSVTVEQLFYQLNMSLKIVCVILAAVIFFMTTEPSTLAASLNHIGLSYRISYLIGLALRYIPDVRRDYRIISQAQQARGVELSRESNVLRRIKNSAAILIPLFLSSHRRIDSISNALELRSFGKGKKRTWYHHQALTGIDVIFIVLSLLLLVGGLILTFHNGDRYFYPFPA